MKMPNDIHTLRALSLKPIVVVSPKRDPQDLLFSLKSLRYSILILYVFDSF